MTFGLLKTVGLGPSETRSSAYRKPRPCGNPQNSAENRRSSNDANRKESCGFLLTLLPPVDIRGATGLLNARVKLVGLAMVGARP